MSRRRRVQHKAIWAVRRTREITQTEGLSGVALKAAEFLRKRQLRRRPFTALGAAHGSFRGAVVMLAGAEPEQCWHYRVEQKQQAFAELDVPFLVVQPSERTRLFNCLQVASCLIVFRLPGDGLLQEVIAEARRLAIPVIYEADDIVYRTDLVAANPNLATVPKPLRNAVIDGAEGYAAGLAMCDAVIASTDELAAEMAREVPGPAAVVENGIDAAMLSMQRGIDVERAAGRIRTGDDGQVLIGYGSGSRAHDHDLLIAAPALAEVMAAHPNVRLRLFGPLAVPAPLAGFSDRIDRVAMLPAGEFLWEMAHCDIAIAPLADIPFNHFKSQVKYLEAGLLRLPFVASPTVYSRYVDPGVTGLLADDDAQWRDALDSLITDPQLRASLGEAAAKDVMRWTVSTTTTAQLDEALTAFGVKVA